MKISRQYLGVVFGIIVFIAIMAEVAYIRHNYAPSIELDQTIENVAFSKNITVYEKAYLGSNVTKGALDTNDFMREAEEKNASEIYYAISTLDNSLEKKYWISTGCGIADELKQTYDPPIKTMMPWPPILKDFIFKSSLMISIERYDSRTVEYRTTNPVYSYTSYAVAGVFIAFLAGYLLWLVFFLLGKEEIGK